MALNFQQVYEKIKQIGLGARTHQENLERLRERARHCLEEWAGKGAELREKVERARQVDPNIRCAIPLNEHLDASTSEPESEKPIHPAGRGRLADPPRPACCQPLFAGQRGRDRNSARVRAEPADFHRQHACSSPTNSTRRPGW